MMSISSQKGIYLIPVEISVALFLSAKLGLPAIVYLIAVIPAALIFFPLGLASGLKNAGNTSQTDKLLAILSGILFASVICLSAVYLFRDGSRTLKTVIELFGLGILGLGIYFHAVRKDTDEFVLHYCFLCIISVVIVV